MKRSAVTLTQQQARNLHLSAQGLLHPPTKAASCKALRACVERMGLLQIDTIHVVARSPYLVLFSRLGSYPSHWLEDALARAEVFETWAHEACFAPMSDLLAHRTFNREARSHWGLSHAQAIHAKQRAQLDELLQHIQVNGPVKSSDFERAPGESSAWWGWKDEKRWLEALFASGELMVSRREKFQRVYDLAHRVAPVLNDQAASLPPDVADVRKQFLLKSVAALGITQARWINDYYRSKPRLKDADLDVLVEQGELLRIEVEGWGVPGYVHPMQRSVLQKIASAALQPSHTTVLSPFDPVVWDRERALSLFDFDYRLECYTPEAKRVYGYFVLPILCRGELIGRLDAKAHRDRGVFEIKTLHAQPGLRWTESQVDDVAHALVRCAQWHETPQIQVGRTQPASLAAALRRAVRTAAQQDAW